MRRKQTQQIIYRHADLITDPLVDTSSAIAGFAVSNNSHLTVSEHFKNYFRSDFFAIIFVKKGTATFTFNLKKFIVKENDLLVFAPNIIKQLVTASDNAVISAVSFTANFLTKSGMSKNDAELMDYFSVGRPPLWGLTEVDAALCSSLISQLYERNAGLKQHVYGTELLYHTFQIFFYEMKALSLQYTNLQYGGLSRKENLVMNLTALVQKQFRFQRNVQEYARQLHVAPKYLTETVKEITGKTAGEIIDDFVLLESKLLLDDASLSIAQVAEALHFSDQSFFGKYFKRNSGLSPKAYRNNS